MPPKKQRLLNKSYYVVAGAISGVDCGPSLAVLHDLGALKVYRLSDAMCIGEGDSHSLLGCALEQASMGELPRSLDIFALGCTDRVLPLAAPLASPTVSGA